MLQAPFLSFFNPVYLCSVYTLLNIQTSHSLAGSGTGAWAPSTLTWVVLGQAGQGLRGVHANIILGEDDLAVQARAQRRAPRPGVKGQEVGGLGGGAPQEPTQRHLLRRGDAGPILCTQREREESCF